MIVIVQTCGDPTLDSCLVLFTGNGNAFNNHCHGYKSVFNITWQHDHSRNPGWACAVLQKLIYSINGEYAAIDVCGVSRGGCAVLCLFDASYGIPSFMARHVRWSSIGASCIWQSQDHDLPRRVASGMRMWQGMRQGEPCIKLAVESKSDFTVKTHGHYAKKKSKKLLRRIRCSTQRDRPVYREVHFIALSQPQCRL